MNITTDKDILKLLKINIGEEYVCGRIYIMN